MSTPPDAASHSGKDAHAAAKLLPMVYDQLRQIARRQLDKLPPGQTLQPTAVVHEAYLKLSDDDRASWGGRTFFFAAAARAIRDIVVDHVRARQAAKRGGNRPRIVLGDLEIAQVDDGVDVLALDELLRGLEEHDPRLCEVVNLRYFAGLSLEEAAETLGVSLATVNRDWRFAKAWLMKELAKGETAVAPPHRRE